MMRNLRNVDLASVVNGVAGSVTLVGTKDVLSPNHPLIVLSTGGAAGLWQAAVLEKLISERNVIKDKFQFLGGSAGSVNTWLLSKYVAQAHINFETKDRFGNKQFKSVDDALRSLIAIYPLTSVWEQVIYPFMMDGGKLKNALKFIINRGFIKRTDKLYEDLVSYMSYIDSAVITGQAEERFDLPFMGTVAHDLNSGASVVANQSDSEFHSVTKGSAAIPLVFKEVALGQRLLVDIGVTDPLVFLTMLKLVENSEIAHSKVYLVVAQETGLYRNFFSDRWLKRSVGKSVNWLKETVFDSLVSAHLRLAQELGCEIIEMDSDLMLGFSSDHTVKNAVIKRGYSQGNDLNELIK